MTRRQVIMTSMGIALVRVLLIGSLVGAVASTDLRINITPIGCSIDNVNSGENISLHLTPAECSEEEPKIVETVIDSGGSRPAIDYVVIRDKPEPDLNQADTLGEGRIAVGADQVYADLAQALAVQPEQLKEATATAYGVGVIVVFVVAIIAIMTL